MAEENPSGQVWPQNPPASGENPPLGTGEGESPLAPQGAPKFDARTMASDLNSIQESGGASPRPYVPPPTPYAGRESETTPPASPSIPGGAFEPSPVVTEEALQFPSSPPETKPKSKKTFAFVLVVLIIVGLGAVGYFFVYPYFFGSEEVAEETLPPPPPFLEVPQIPEVPGAPVIETPPPPLFEGGQFSLFKVPADSISEVNLGPLDLLALRQAFDNQTADVAILKEVIVKTQSEFATVNDVLSVFMPGVFGAQLNDLFESSLTVFQYINSKGVWPGLVLKLKSGVQLADAQTRISVLEESPEVTNFYLTDPGTWSGTWKNGQGGPSNRYTAFSKPGFYLNYGWVGNLLLISASYDGFKEALRRLQ